VHLLVIGGGVNGCAIARDAAGRGLSVLLAEQGDLAQGTSSASSKLIHGGLRYLEQFEFRLVREALAEREVLLANAPHIVRPLRFVLPHDAGRRPAWMLRAGLFIYDHVGGRGRLPGSRGIDLASDPAGPPLQPRFRKGFTYADCRTDDARLVILNAKDAAERGAEIRTYTHALGASRTDGLWEVTLQPMPEGEPYLVRARALVNAAGPWIAQVMAQTLKRPGYRHLRLVKGSHLLFPRLYEGSHAYILQNTDGRVVFAIPFLDRYTLIGTTDVPYTGDPGRAAIEPGEARYLCDAVNRYFARALHPGQAVWSFAGVRPLYDDRAAAASRVSRDWVLELEADKGRAPLLAVIGGKLTAHRQVAEQALERLAPFLGPLGPPWTHDAPLPGGDIPGGDVAAYLSALRVGHPWLPEELARRWVDAYGTRARLLLAEARTQEALGRHFGAGLYQREVEYLIREEWARTAEDLLWRRTKLGLEFTQEQTHALEQWLAQPVER
jgi:glycerol-3-phosphate dehydrogenase